MMERLPHTLVWDDEHGANQQIDAGEMMRRLATVLAGELETKHFRGEPRYQIKRFYPGGFELLIVAGHVYDDREALSMTFELGAAAMDRPLASYHLSGGLQRIKASRHTAWIRASNGTVVLVGEGLGGYLEIQN